eukprot:1189927-Pleurochrysis_carterae.AAC.1
MAGILALASGSRLKGRAQRYHTSLCVKAAECCGCHRTTGQVQDRHGNSARCVVSASKLPLVTRACARLETASVPVQAALRARQKEMPRRLRIVDRAGTDPTHWAGTTGTSPATSGTSRAASAHARAGDNCFTFRRSSAAAPYTLRRPTRSILSCLAASSWHDLQLRRTGLGPS